MRSVTDLERCLDRFQVLCVVARNWETVLCHAETEETAGRALEELRKVELERDLLRNNILKAYGGR